MVKAFIVLSPAYTSHDPEALTRELQDHVKKVTAPYKYPRKVSTKGPRTKAKEESGGCLLPGLLSYIGQGSAPEVCTPQLLLRLCLSSVDISKNTYVLALRTALWMSQRV